LRTTGDGSLNGRFATLSGPDGAVGRADRSVLL
jgi:hypothetical protein